MDVIYVFSGRRNLRQKIVNFQPDFKHKSMILLLISLIFLWCAKVNYNIYFLIQTSNCGLIIFSALLCNFQHRKSEVFFLSILKCVEAFVRKLISMMIRTCTIMNDVQYMNNKSASCSQKRYVKKIRKYLQGKLEFQIA